MECLILKKVKNRTVAHNNSPAHESSTFNNARPKRTVHIPRRFLDLKHGKWWLQVVRIQEEYACISFYLYLFSVISFAASCAQYGPYMATQEKLFASWPYILYKRLMQELIKKYLQIFFCNLFFLPLFSSYQLFYRHFPLSLISTVTFWCFLLLISPPPS